MVRQKKTSVVSVCKWAFGFVEIAKNEVKVVFVTLNQLSRNSIWLLCTLQTLRHQSQVQKEGRFKTLIVLNFLLQFPPRITDALYFVQLTFSFPFWLEPRPFFLTVGVRFPFFYCTKLPSGIGNDISVYRRVPVHRGTQLCSLAVT